ncbi:MAG: tRNA (N6-isopentenyl adenosine(37)-C2)-methylthiotransferase MiaB [Desulfobacteraceae bacterium]|nr:tRNA (N6-isopentenyl adenosine(37)-C2)-methylthiotransferase MiaB [Desulfobacteraceae bacterium]
MDSTRTFYIETMGCQMNEYDSDSLAQSLIQSGSYPVNDPKDANVILINTCTVRAKPEQKAYSLLGRMSSLKRRNPKIILGIVGCLAQQKGANLMKRFPELDLVMGPRELGRIQEFLEKIYADRNKIVATNLKQAAFPRIFYQGYFSGRVTGYISIMEGCNNFCSYCIVPFVRGKEISRSPHEILAEAKSLLSEGVKDITLLGQNVNSYFWEEGERWDFSCLLHKVSKLDGLLRLRFTTSHPKDLSDELIQCFRNISNICPHIHLPFQAGSNSVLKRMRRGYTREKYLELISKLRDVKPTIAITSDVMVGFPGESEEDFCMTLDLIKQVQFDSLFSFKYSDRIGTLAEKMKDKVEDFEKAKQLKVLQTIQKQITLNKNKALEGRQVEVLVEGQSKKGKQLTGRTESNKIVNFDWKKSKIGNLVEVTIKQGYLNSLIGEPYLDQ